MTGKEPRSHRGCEGGRMSQFILTVDHTMPVNYFLSPPFLFALKTVLVWMINYTASLPIWSCHLLWPHQLPHFLYSLPTLLLLINARNIPAPGPLHWLSCLPGLLFPSILAWRPPHLLQGLLEELQPFTLTIQSSSPVQFFS